MYTCPICGKEHSTENGIQICPRVYKKMSSNFMKKNNVFLYANILLECAKRKITSNDFQGILKEIAYIDTISLPPLREKIDARNFNAELFINYFSASLRCPVSAFFKTPETTIAEYYDLLKYKNPYSIEIEQNESLLIFELPEKFGFLQTKRKDLTLCLERSLDGNKQEYTLYINNNHLNSTWLQPYLGMFQPIPVQYIMISNFSTIGELVSSDGGLLEKLFYKYISLEDLAEKISYDDPRFEIWIKKLCTATDQKLMYWIITQDYHYKSFYENNEIHFNTGKLYIKFNDGNSICFDNTLDFIDDNKRNAFLYRLEKCILKDIEQRKNPLKYTKNLTEKNIAYNYVLVRTHMLNCKKQGHTITPCRGIVKLLTPDQKIVDYYIYLGWCKQCHLYFIFEDDYNIMRKNGTPLCNVIEYDSIDKRQTLAFQYQSQSILFAMGYNVHEKYHLSDRERQEILSTAIENKNISIHEILDLLNWLIRTRKTQSKYANAVEKWKRDKEFVSNYKVENREIKNINTIYIKERTQKSSVYKK